MQEKSSQKIISAERKSAVDDYLHRKLSLVWKEGMNWKIILIGKGFNDFPFNSIEDMRKIWALGVVNLNPGLLRFMKWTNDFNPMN